MMQMASYTPEELKAIQAKKYDSVAVFSGGLDSTTLVYDMMDKGYTPLLLSFNYGQRHVKELFYARNTAIKLGLRHEVIDLTGITHLISNSALTDTSPKMIPSGNPYDKAERIEVPEGHYAEDTMKLTVVPNRNMMMLAIAAAAAVNLSAECVGCGVHAGDHFVYPDCRPPFFSALSAAVLLGNEGFGGVERQQLYDGRQYFYTPFIDKSKADIAYYAINLSMPFEDTWSCYKGGDYHCGKCGTCVERLEAIDHAVTRYNKETGDSYIPAMLDRTIYKDSTYWTTVTKVK